MRTSPSTYAVDLPSSRLPKEALHIIRSYVRHSLVIYLRSHSRARDRIASASAISAKGVKPSDVPFVSPLATAYIAAGTSTASDSSCGNSLLGGTLNKGRTRAHPIDSLRTHVGG